MAASLDRVGRHSLLLARKRRASEMLIKLCDLLCMLDRWVRGCGRVTLFP